MKIACLFGILTCFSFCMPFVIMTCIAIQHELPRQTAALEQISANARQPVAITLQDVSPEAVATLAEAARPVAGKKGRR